GPPRPLPSRGPRGPDGGQRAQPARVVHPRLTRETRVHHHPHPGNRQRRLRHRRRQHHPAPPAGGEHRVLHGRRSPPVHLEHLHAPGVPEVRRDPGDLPHPGQEDQHVPVPFGERPPHHRRHVCQEHRVHARPVRRPDRARGRRPHHLHRERGAGR